MTTPEDAPAGAHQGLTPVKLYLLLLKIGAIGFGGGMAVISLMEREFVGKRQLVSAGEFVQGVGLGQVLGSFAVNAAFFVGYRLFGPLAGVISAAIFLLPSFALVCGLSQLYFTYHRIPALEGAVTGLGPVVIALIVTAGWSLGRQVVLSWRAAVLAAAALVCGAFRVNSVWTLLACGAVGLVFCKDPEPDGPPPREPIATGFFAAAIPAVPALTGIGAMGLQFFKLGFVFLGGGFALVPVLHDRLVVGLHWLTAREFLDGVAISNLTPGPIAVLSTFAGYRLNGIWGALVATIALFTPGIAVMMFLTRQYGRLREAPAVRRFLAGVGPAVAGLVISAAITLSGKALDSWRGWVLFAASLFLLGKLRWHPAAVLAVGVAAGALHLVA